MNNPKIGVVGAGAMGFPIAENIAKAQLDPLVVDANPKAVSALQSLDIQASQSIGSVWDTDLIVICVASQEQLDSVAQTLEEHHQVRDRLVVVLSTVGPHYMEEFTVRVSKYGVRVVDSPMTGGVSGAKQGALKFMCSGAPDDVAAAVKVLDGVIGTFQPVGTTPGQGQSVKLINNLLSSIHLVAAAEAVNLAESLGLDAAQLTDILVSGAGDSWMMRERYPRMAQPADQREFDTALHIFCKDTQLIKHEAQQVGAFSPLIQAAESIFSEAGQIAGPMQDDTYVADLYRRKSQDNGGKRL